MEENKKYLKYLRYLLIFIAVGTFLYFITVYLNSVYQNDRSERLIYSIVLISALVVGLAHIVLFIFRKSLESQNTNLAKRKKRRLEKIRNIVNYITPFVLVAMGYHFWQKGWVLAAIIVAVLLLDRLNELLRKNK